MGLKKFLKKVEKQVKESGLVDAVVDAAHAAEDYAEARTVAKEKMEGVQPPTYPCFHGDYDAYQAADREYFKQVGAYTATVSMIESDKNEARADLHQATAVVKDKAKEALRKI